MSMSSAHGRIITFYSFKGGTGRTMAVSNCAFLAAQSGLRVLVMDWDLEAPGLSHYFRTLREPAVTRLWRDTPGVLNLLWNWSAAVDRCQTEEEFANIQHDYARGDAFRACLRSVLPPQHTPPGACLDFISAGSAIQQDGRTIPYEQALANFSWPEFFDAKAGGYALNCLREWARQHYDVVLIDSRTGLADVAGLCTLQLPDAVALCFILNRQNVEGVSQIANTICTRRGRDIDIHAVPMRLARNGSAAESDAAARAMSELVQTGAFTRDSIEAQFQQHAIALADNLPYHECIAPFVAADTETDPVTLAYVRLARHLINPAIQVPTLDKDWIADVRERMQPRLATDDYLQKLVLAEPSRAVHEIMHLLDGASLLGDGLNVPDDTYIARLCDAALKIGQHPGADERGPEVIQRSLDLLRALAASDPERWRNALIEHLLAALEFPLAFQDTDVLALEGELEELLDSEPGLHNTLLRLELRDRRIRADLIAGEVESARWMLDNMAELLASVELPVLPSLPARPASTDSDDAADKAPDKASDKAAPDRSANAAIDLLWYRVDWHLLRGDMHRARAEPDAACEQYRAGLQQLQQADRSGLDSALRARMSDLGAALHAELCELLQTNHDPAAATHALACLGWGDGDLVVERSPNLIKAVLDADPDALQHFCAVYLTQYEQHPAWRRRRRFDQNLALVGALLEMLEAIDRQPLYDHRFDLRLVNLIGTVLQPYARHAATSEEFDDPRALHVFQQLQLTIERLDLSSALAFLPQLIRKAEAARLQRSTSRRKR